MQLSLRYDLRSAPGIGAEHADLYRACIEQCEWADQNGFDYVRLTEHHGSEDGFMCSPLVVASAVAARTRRLRIRIAVLLLPLHDPIRVAEDAATVDIVSQGRLELTVAGGYVPFEYEMFGKQLERRPEYLMAYLDAIKRAWIEDEFDFDGRRVRVTPKPFSKPRPPIYLGGSSPAMARRAAGRADGYEGTFEEVYIEECKRLGVPPGRTTSHIPRPTASAGFLHVTHDPERDWQTIARFADYETRTYQEWAKAGRVTISASTIAADDPAVMRRYYPVLRPEECLALGERLGPDGDLRFHPLMGGMSPELGWSSLRLFASEVVPELRRRGLVGEPAGVAS